MNHPRRAARLVSLPAWAAWVSTIVLFAIGLAGAVISVFVGDMYGHDIAGGRRTDQLGSLAAGYLAAAGFLAIPVYVVGAYRQDTRLRWVALGVFLAVSAFLLARWAWM